MKKIKCNNCNWTGNEDDFSPVKFDAERLNEAPTGMEKSVSVNRILPKPWGGGYLKGCPNCMTDSYLMDI